MLEVDNNNRDLLEYYTAEEIDLVKSIISTHLHEISREYNKCQNYIKRKSTIIFTDPTIRLDVQNACRDLSKRVSIDKVLELYHYNIARIVESTTFEDNTNAKCTSSQIHPFTCSCFRNTDANQTRIEGCTRIYIITLTK